MAKSLYHKSWDEIMKEMSMAGNPEKMTAFGKRVLELSVQFIDKRNIPDYINAIFALERVIAELKAAQKRQEKVHSIGL
jgi:hypothetical protein